ncbi:MAG: NADPH:quinone oxidoreductase family protein [Pseudomonadota bacterium]
MRAAICHDFDSPLAIDDVPTPAPAAGEVAVRVEACGVNFVDGLIVSGRYQLKPQLPHIPGFEIAGVVTAVGTAAMAFKPGDAVFATCGLDGGGYAQYVALPEDRVFHRPAHLSAGQAATFVQSYCTALFALTRRIQIQPGQHLLTLGASGGVGRAALDVGTALGARVIAAASSRERLDYCRALQPAATIDYSRADLKTAARAASGGGVDVVLDPLGGDHTEPALRALTDDGALLVVGFAAGTIPRLPANQILLRNRRVIGVDWGGWRSRHPNLQAELMAELRALLEQGKLQPAEPTAAPLHEVNEVLRTVNGRGVVGKYVLTP